MGEDNNLEPERNEPQPAPTDVAASGETSAGAAEKSEGSAKGLTPGQRLAAKKAEKAQHKREFKEELRRKEEEAREKEQEEAQRLIAPPAEPALPDEVQKVAGDFTDFVQHHRGNILIGVAAVIGLSLGGILLRNYLNSGSAEQASLLSAAYDLSVAPIDAEDADGKTDDGKPVFKTREDRAAKTAAAFETAVKNRPDSLAASWGRLSEASIELTSGHADKAQPLYQNVYDKYKTDTVLGARALEGLAISLETAGKVEDAKKRFEELKALDKDLGEYHIARLKLAAGDREGAKQLLKGLYDRLSERREGAPPSRYLKGEVEQRLSEIDSSLVDKGASGDGQQGFSQEELQRLIEQMQKKGGLPAGSPE